MFARRTEDHSLAYHGDGLGADLPARDGPGPMIT